jgi:PKHD-type hydroxylase
MKNFYTREILDEESVRLIRNVLDQSNTNNFWSNGLNSGGGFSRIKNNVELSNIHFVNKINQLIMNSLDKDSSFINFTAAKSTSLNIISKTTSGGYYNPHYDNWSNGDYSTTVFLNEPEEYIGGELCLYVGGEEEIKIKLKSGWGITYQTGILHRVNRVVSGTRYASVFWTESLIKDPLIRYIYGEICEIQKNMVKYESSVHLSDCLTASKDPHFSLENLRMQILRNYSGK